MAYYFPSGFEPCRAYDGFISEIGRRYECGLCREGKTTYRKTKKDAPRHLRQIHFGVGTRVESGAFSGHLIGTT